MLAQANTNADGSAVDDGDPDTPPALVTAVQNELWTRFGSLDLLRDASGALIKEAGDIDVQAEYTGNFRGVV